MPKFDTKKLTDSLNGLLPDDISILKVTETSIDFDARFTAKKKTYQFLFYVSKYKHPIPLAVFIFLI